MPGPQLLTFYCCCLPAATLEGELRQRAQLTHTKEMIRSVGQLAGATTVAVKRIRFGLGLTSLVGAAVNAGGALRHRMRVAAVDNLVQQGQGQQLGTWDEASGGQPSEGPAADSLPPRRRR